MRSLFEPKTSPSLERNLLGLPFKHPIGLAAGFDKDARWLGPLSALGFSFIEIGTVTPRPQSGNAKPRLFRLPKDKALINRMGFNNQGAQAAATRLEQYRKGLRGSIGPVIGGNIGKNKDTPNEQATEDYRIAFRALYPWVDYFVVNVSSPNTPGLRELQEREPLTRLLQQLHKDNISLCQELSLPSPRPVLLKIAPDLSEHQLSDIAGLIRETHLKGLVCTNTTISREGLQSSEKLLQSYGSGGLSGDPLRERATEIIALMRQLCGPDFPIIGVGGIRTAGHALEKLQAGANLLQLYTGFVYEGPGIVRAILDGMEDLKKHLPNFNSNNN